MKIFRTRSAAAIAIAAALSVTATPVMARGGWHHRHHDRIDGGDILAGLLVIGGIAAIASAASSKNKQNREADYRYPDRDPRAEDTYEVPPAGYGDYRDDRGDRDDRSYGASDRDPNAAVDRCVDEVERGNRRVDRIDTVNRSADGWSVEGRADGRDFTCSVDRDGRIRGVTVDGSAI